MKNLTQTERLLYLTINDQGKIENKSTITSYVYAMALITQVLDAGYFIKDEEGKLVVNKPLPTEMAYLQSVYNYVEKKKSVKLNKLIEKIYDASNSKGSREARQQDLENLVAKELLVKKEETGLLGLSKMRYYADKKAQQELVDKAIKTYEENNEDEDSITLLYLLSNGNLLKHYSDKQVSKEITKQLKNTAKTTERLKNMREIKSAYDDEIAGSVVIIT